MPLRARLHPEVHTRKKNQTYRYFDEYDPANLHLGKALAPEAKVGNLHACEFEDGWVVVNGTTTRQTSRPVMTTSTTPAPGRVIPIVLGAFESGHDEMTLAHLPFLAAPCADIALALAEAEAFF